MLLKLLARDWRLHSRTLWITLAIFAGFQIYFVMNIDRPPLWVGFAAVYLSFLTITPITREEKFRSMAWTCSLPVSRRDVVRARFAGAWLIVGIGILLGLGVALLTPGSKVDAAAVMSIDSLLLACGLATVVLVLLLPFTLRYGIKGVFIVLVGLQILGAGALVVGMATGTMTAIESGVGAVFGPVYRTVLNLHEGLSAPSFFAVMAVFLAALNWGGYRLALALFRRLEL